MTRLSRADGGALIIAEIGNNHEGSSAAALDLITRAAGAGADAVKFQTFCTDLFVRPADTGRYEQLKRFELSVETFAVLAAAARDRGLMFIATPLDLESARVLEPLVDAFKIASGDITFTALLQQVARSGKPVVLSSGASDLSEIQQAVAWLREVWARVGVSPDLVVLHCVSCYPTPDHEASLGAIPFLRSRLGLPIGYSDHTLGIEAGVLAAVLGACVIEKHFTLDKHYSDFRDHQLSADASELKSLVQRIRHAEAMVGQTDKRSQPCEVPMRTAIRRSIVTAGDLPAGHLLGERDLAWMRPATGLPPGREAELIGRRLRRAISRGEMLTPADID